jgi:hypothetical protein
MQKLSGITILGKGTLKTSLPNPGFAYMFGSHFFLFVMLGAVDLVSLSRFSLISMGGFQVLQSELTF